MERNFREFIKEKFNKYNNYDLYNYIASEFVDDVEEYSLNQKEEDIFDYLSDSVYDIEMNYYDDKNKYEFDKAKSILVENIDKMKKEALKMFE